MDLKSYYNTILCQSFSPDGQHLLAGNIFGEVAIYNLSDVFSPRSTDSDELLGPNDKFSPNGEESIESMIFADNFLLIGTAGYITAWDWQSLVSHPSKTKSDWTIQMPYRNNDFANPFVDCMVHSKTDNVLYAGCGDSNIYVFNLEDGQLLRKLSGHEDFIHSISLMDNQLVSGGEDGTVRLWDLRQKQETNILKPYLNEKIARPNLGKWIGSVDTTQEWLLCGGGPKLSVWHMRTMEPATIFNVADEGIHAAHMTNERIIAGGVAPFVFHLDYQGKILAKVPVACNTVHSIVFQDTPHRVVSIAGTSNNIDICANYNYEEMRLKFS